VVADNSGAIIRWYEAFAQSSGDERYQDARCGQAANQTAIETERE
jgi:hypothetical protein